MTLDEFENTILNEGFEERLFAYEEMTPKLIKLARAAENLPDSWKTNELSKCLKEVFGDDA